MRFTLCLAVLASVASMTGCASAVAIHPFYTSPDLVSDLPLEGTWSGGDQVWQIQRSDDGYVVTTQNETFNVHLLRLKDSEFVDVASKSDPQIGVAGHLIGKIAVVEGELYISPIDETWLKQMVDAGLAPESTMGEGRQIVLTAPTRDLQQFILQHVSDPAAWDDDDEGLQRLH